MIVFIHIFVFRRKPNTQIGLQNFVNQLLSLTAVGSFSSFKIFPFTKTKAELIKLKILFKS